ncbi:MAG: methyltransferase domain-containing protein, partial [Sporichthyaceae bacterium]|nr:methyltransferase domain-containing protein [Sporichthyaceae bacterium]
AALEEPRGGPGDAPVDFRERLAHLEQRLLAAGVLDDPAWRAALRTVPRYRFIPDVAWIRGTGPNDRIDRRSDAARWWDAVTGDGVIVTQLNDDARPTPAPDVDRRVDRRAVVTSSCPMPLVVFEMLRALDVEAGMRVLEIGTGTGWNAALLSHRLGERNIVTVEVDHAIADAARGAPAAVGYRPTVVAADGSDGHRPGAPYDRVIATCAVGDVPPAWIAQTRPGGVLVVPWAADPGGGPLVRLTVAGDGSASGPFVGQVAFMWLRQQRPTRDGPPLDLHDAGAHAVTSAATVDPLRVLFDDPNAMFAVRLGLRGCRYGLRTDRATGTRLVWLSDRRSGSWARVRCPTADATSSPGAADDAGD